MMVADTDVLIDFLHGTSPGAERIAIELRTGGLKTTAVTRFELLSGARNADVRRKVDKLLAAVGTLGLDVDSADRAAQIRRDLEAGGNPIGMADSLIAGIVLRHGGVLLTRNRRHFERVPGLFIGMQQEQSAGG